MAPQTPESTPVADRARRLIELGVGSRVRFQKFRRMIGGPQLGAGAMTAFTTERQLDFSMTNQAVGHLRHVRPAHRIRCLDAAVARQAGVRSVQLRADVAGGREVLAAVDGLGDDGRDVAELQVLFVAEVRQQRLWWRGNRCILVAWLTHRR